MSLYPSYVYKHYRVVIGAIATAAGDISYTMHHTSSQVYPVGTDYVYDQVRITLFKAVNIDFV